MTAFLGAGIGYRKAHRRDLLEAPGDARPRVLEVIPSHFFADPDALAPIADAYPIVFHEVGLSIGTSPADPTGRAILERIRALVRIGRPALMSDHLAITRSPGGIDIGHLAPIFPTEEALANVIDRVRAWQDALGIPICLENIAAPFVLDGADMSEADFLARVVDATGCGVLLDLSNLLANAHNFGFDAATRLADYPLEAVWQAHLAGGAVHRGFWVDSHDAPVGDASYRLLAALRDRAKLRAIIVERDERIPELAALVAEANRAAAIWEKGE
jgi:uncharacterized protein (UPF0276 family)